MNLFINNLHDGGLLDNKLDETSQSMKELKKSTFSSIVAGVLVLDPLSDVLST
jgi:DNA-directed RNA polymerase specialized sigma54-like protein